MKKTIPFAPFLLLVLNSQPCFALGESDNSELVGLVKGWLAATSKGDSGALELLIDERFIGTSFSGNFVHKSDIVHSGEANEDRRTQLSLEESASLRMGDTGIVMGKVNVAGADSPGPFRFTVVFIRRNQDWRMVAAHLSRAKE
jgi:hypothetical protein